MSELVYTALYSVLYARAFFVTEPNETPFEVGEVRYFPILYVLGSPAATAFELVWYADRANADADTNRLTDTARLPSAVFEPLVPDSDASSSGLQEGEVQLTRPDTAQTGDYANPVGVILMTQETETTKPRIYLLSDTLEISPSAYRTYDFRYAIGDPPISSFYIEWYATRLDAKRMINRLSDTDRLPRADFFPSAPNRDAEADELQRGTLRLRAAVGDNPYTSAVGLLCVEQDLRRAAPVKKDVDIKEPSRKAKTRPKWEEF